MPLRVANCGREQRLSSASGHPACGATNDAAGVPRGRGSHSRCYNGQEPGETGLKGGWADVNTFNLALLVVGCTVILLGLFSRVLERMCLSLPLVALIIGVILGNVASSAYLPAQDEGTKLFLEEAARLTLGVSLMGVALRLPRRFFTDYRRALLVLLGVIMPLMWVSSSLILIRAGLSVLVGIQIAAAVTPTDPVLASSIVTGKIAVDRVSKRVRDVISAESGANDGLAYAFVLAPLAFMSGSVGMAPDAWVMGVLFRGVLLAIGMGIGLGYGAGRLLHVVRKRHLVSRVSLLPYAAGLSLTVLGGAKLVGSDGILAVFVAGAAFSFASPRPEEELREEQGHFQEALNRFFILPIFVFLGIVLPWSAWGDLGWTPWVATGLILLFRRLPWVLLLRRFMGGSFTIPDALFIGWFGPIGVAAIYYSLLVERLTGSATAWQVGTLLVCASIVVHGLTATPLARLYARHNDGRSMSILDSVLDR